MRGSGRTQRAKRALFALLALGASVVLCLAAAEIGLRIAGFEFALFPTKVQFGWPDPVTLKRQYRFDKDLLWVTRDYDEKLAEARATHPSLVFMGCSVTEFARFDDAFKAAFDAAAPGRDLHFLNLGVGGWSSYQGLHQLERDVLPLKPRVVMILYGWNDHWVTFGLEDREIGKYNLELPRWMLRLAEFRVVQLVNRALVAWRKPSDDEAPAPRRVPLDQFESNLTQMVRLLKQAGSVPVLVTAPSSHVRGHEPAYLANGWLDDLSELVPLHERYVQAVRDVAKREHAHLIDLAAEFRTRVPKDELPSMFGDDGIHLSDAGTQLVAKIYREYFEREDLDRLLQ